MTRFLIIGNPDNRRIAFFREALRKYSPGPAAVLSYRELLGGSESLREYLEPGTIIRIESPGEDARVEQRLIALGEDNSPIPGDFLYEAGRIYAPSSWYRGYCILLNRLEREAAAFAGKSPGLAPVWMNPPGDIALMFDKSACHTRLKQRGVRVPPALAPPIRSYDELRARMAKERTWRVFVKLNYGSSASGVVAYELHPGGKQEQAYTTVELVEKASGPVLYNSLKLKRYRRRHTIAAIIDWLCGQGVHVEQWIPKEMYGKETFDFRLVVTAGKPAQRVARLSRGPITNLHLGNRRGGETMNRELAHHWRAAAGMACLAMTCFPGSLYAGVDLLIPGGGGKPFVNEINAFGDLLPGLLYRRENTYETQIRRLSARLDKRSRL